MIHGVLLTMTDHKNVIVKKPWGKEYLIFENVGIWALHINKGESTSLHCHPKKNTGLIILKGEVEVSFLNDSRIHVPMDKIMIRRGLFHSSKAITDAVILEIESPKDKLDLVRFTDNYGRKYKPYEGKDQEIERTDELWIEVPEDHIVSCKSAFGKLFVTERTNTGRIPLTTHELDIIIICEGGIIDQKTGWYVAAPGDVITSKVMNILLERFNPTQSLVTIKIPVGKG